MNSQRWRRRCATGVQILLILYWLARLQKTDSYYIIYLLIGAGGLCGLSRGETGWGDAGPRWEKLLTAAFAALLSGMTAASNYSLFSTIAPVSGTVGMLLACLAFALTLAGGFAAFFRLTVFLTARLRTCFWAETPGGKHRPAAVFFAAMAAFAALDLAVWFLTNYPCVATTDSFNQMFQVLAGTYKNHHPFYHTQLIRLFMRLGLSVFHTWSSGAVMYAVFQILAMSACFAYAVVTLYEMRISPALVIGCGLWYLLMPYHIIYSFTMWKDVLFGGLTLVFITALFRRMYGVGQRRLPDFLLLFVGGVGMCLFRSNGLPAFVLTVLVFAVLFGKREWKLALLMGGALVLSVVLKYPVLSRLDVKQASPVESLSIPVQQIARVITDCNDLTEEERTLLEKVIDVDAVPEAYCSWLSDPIKLLVLHTGDVDYLAGHKMEYLRLWARLLLRHPAEYVKAWIDQTRGYWNGGYDYWFCSTEIVQPNEFQLEQTIRWPAGRTALQTYAELFQFSPLLQPFVSIGLHVWFVLGLAVLGLLRRSRAAILTVPVLALAATLVMAMPVYSEFRYAYAVFTSLPILLFGSFYRDQRGDRETNG